MPSGSSDFNLVHEDRKPGDFHGRVLRELFGVVSCSVPPKDEALFSEQHFKVAHSPA
jgi:hypothetical protein